MSKKVFISASKKIRLGDCKTIVDTLKKRALAVAIISTDLQFYKEGTFKPKSGAINHGVTLVGYDPDKGYLIKNSWGKSWGIEGYAYVGI